MQSVDSLVHQSQLINVLHAETEGALDQKSCEERSNHVVQHSHTSQKVTLKFETPAVLSYSFHTSVESTCTMIVCASTLWNP